LQITDERKKGVIDLYFNQHKTYAEIAQIEKISPRDIHAIIKEEEDRRQKHKDRQQQEEKSSKAYKLFSKGNRPVEVAITLNLRQPEATKLYGEYWRLKRLYILNSIYKETNGKLGPFLKLYQLMKEKGMSIDQVVNAVDTAIHRLPYMENLYEQVTDQIDKMQRTRQGLVNDIAGLERKLSVLDKTAFSCEQERMRTEQRVQGLNDKKDKLEKLIANILNGEGYSKLNLFIKENVKVVLSDNKKLISISFAAIIQTLKDDPGMVKLIQNITGRNDGEQHKDHHTNINQYFESNKDRILNLAEKNYENLIEALTNNVMNTAAASSLSNSSLSQKFNFGTWNQSDTYKIEESESHNNSKGGIAD
jgi:hypothetical protein